MESDCKTVRSANSGNVSDGGNMHKPQRSWCCENKNVAGHKLLGSTEISWRDCVCRVSLRSRHWCCENKNVAGHKLLGSTEISWRDCVCRVSLRSRHETGLTVSYLRCQVVSLCRTSSNEYFNSTRYDSSSLCYHQYHNNVGLVKLS